MRVARWGNSLAVRLPRDLIEQSGLSEGDEVSVKLLGNDEIGVGRPPTVEDHLTALRTLRGSMPPDFVFDRNEANER